MPEGAMGEGKKTKQEKMEKEEFSFL